MLQVIESVLRTVANNFITDHHSSEVMAVGYVQWYKINECNLEGLILIIKNVLVKHCLESRGFDVSTLRMNFSRFAIIRPYYGTDILYLIFKRSLH